MTREFYIVKNEKGKILYRGEEIKKVESAMKDTRGTRYKVYSYRLEDYADRADYRGEKKGLTISTMNYCADGRCNGKKRLCQSNCEQTCLMGVEAIKDVIDFLQGDLELACESVSK